MTQEQAAIEYWQNKSKEQQHEITRLKLEWQVWYDQNLALRDRIAYLERQVYGGSTQ